jgi:hypothetical protein
MMVILFSKPEQGVRFVTDGSQHSARTDYFLTEGVTLLEIGTRSAAMAVTRYEYS